MIISENDLIENYEMYFNIEKLSHAYIFEVTDTNNSEDFLIFFLKKALKLNETQINNFKINSLADIIKVDESNNLIKKENILNLIKDINVNPIELSKKVIIIKKPELLTISACNSLLKTLEEPNSTTLFILLTEDYNSVLDTIKSRCMKYKITQETNKQEDEELTNIAQLILKEESNKIMLKTDEYKELFSEKKQLELLIDILIDESLNEKKESYIKYAGVLEEVKKMVNTNVRNDLILDKIIIEKRNCIEK